jgi:hypothetical protein
MILDQMGTRGKSMLRSVIRFGVIWPKHVGHFLTFSTEVWISGRKEWM